MWTATDQPDTTRGLLTRLRAGASRFGAWVRKALGGDDDQRPPGFNGLALLA